jgi:hypothetical protein
MDIPNIYLTLYAHKNNLLDRITGLKYFNVYGPGEFHKSDMRSVVLKGYEQIKSTSKLTLYLNPIKPSTKMENKKGIFSMLKMPPKSQFIFYTIPVLGFLMWEGELQNHGWI